MTQTFERYALLSVSDKRDIETLARAFVDAGIGLLSTGGTASLLERAGLPVQDVAGYTGAQEMMAGRVKTLHPLVHGGILGRRGIDDEVMRERGIVPIDYVVVNLYPFEQTVASPDVSFDDAVENIDIGGPAMVRAAAKNHASVMIVTDPAHYPAVTDSLAGKPGDAAALRQDLAIRAFEHTARYDGMIADWFGRRVNVGPDAPAADFPRTLNRQLDLISPLRYGENPHQKAAFYRDRKAGDGSLATASLVQGKALSYNNVMDADAALACVRQFEEPTSVIVKHANPCGVCSADSLPVAYDRAYHTDATSAFGGIIAFNRPLDAETARAIVERQFVEVIIAPGMLEGVGEVLAGFPNVRLLDCVSMEAGPAPWQYKPVSGGMLVQDDDALSVTRKQCKVVSKLAPTAQQFEDLLFAWKVAKFVKSNAIVYAKNNATVGVGAGQMSRVYSARIAGIKATDAGLEVPGAVMSSDAFFPFRDGIDSAAEAGISAVIQPGGSRRDDEVIAAADEHGMAMVFTGVRHFRH